MIEQGVAATKVGNAVVTTGALSVGVIYLFGISLPMWAAIFSIGWIGYLIVKEFITKGIPAIRKWFK